MRRPDGSVDRWMHDEDRRKEAMERLLDDVVPKIQSPRDLARITARLWADEASRQLASLIEGQIADAIRLYAGTIGGVGSERVREDLRALAGRIESGDFAIENGRPHRGDEGRAYLCWCPRPDGKHSDECGRCGRLIVLRTDRPRWTPPLLPGRGVD